LKFFEASLERHFRIEEEAVFPKARIYLDEAISPVADLLKEHRNLREDVEIFRHPDQKKLGEQLKGFGQLLDKHIRFEERDFFPLCEKEIPPDQLHEIGRQIRKFRKGAG